MSFEPIKISDKNNIEKGNIMEQNEILNLNSKNQNSQNINNNSEIKNSEINEEPIYVMKLALEEGNSENIEIFENSDPSELAYNFCSKHNLDFNALDYLKEQITSLLESYAKNDNEEIDDKESDMNINIPEIEEVQEEQESTENMGGEDNNKFFQMNEDKEKNDNGSLENKSKEMNINETNNSINKKSIEDFNNITNDKKDNLEQINNINDNNKKRRKMDEDIIIGVGNCTNRSEDFLDINDLSINKIERYKKEMLERTNESKKKNENENNIISNSQQSIKSGFQDSKISTKFHNKIINNIEEEKNISIKKSNDIIKLENKQALESLIAKTNRLLNESQNKSNTNREYDNNSKNFISPKNEKKNYSSDTNFFFSNNNSKSNDNKYNLNDYLSNRERKNIKYSSNSVDSSKKNKKCVKKIRDNDEEIKSYQMKERDKLLKQEKEKEIYLIQKEINKSDLTQNITNNMNQSSNDINSKTSSNYFRKGKIKEQFYKTSNYYNKNISIRKLNRLKDEYDKKYSFHPVINDNYKTDLTFDERLNVFNTLAKQKKEELKKKLLNLKVDENGYDLFKPKLISKKYNNKKSQDQSKTNNQEQEDVFNKNYSYYKKYISNKEKLYQKYSELYSNEPQSLNKSQNDKLINTSNHKAFSILFNELDSDQDDLISSVRINLNNIPNNILNIIKPLLTELKEDNQSLNKNEFIHAMDKLFEIIPSTDRRILIHEYLYNPNLRKMHTDNNNSNYYFSKLDLLPKSNNIKLDYNKINIYNNIDCRAKTPMYNTKDKFFSNSIKKQKRQIINTNKLAEKHYIKIQKMMNNYSINVNEEIKDDNCFDGDNIFKRKNNNNNYISSKTPKVNYKGLFLNGDKSFTTINNCTFNNYLKNLN